MTGKIDDATLVAYVDGELDGPATRQVETLMAQDAALAETVRALRETKSLLCAAFNEPERGGVPLKLYSAIHEEFEKAGAAEKTSGRSARRGWSTPAAIAASLVAVIVGLGAGYVLADRQIERRLASLEAQHAADLHVMNAAISRGLETELSGIAVTWRNPDSGSHGTMTPIRSFKNKAGQWCREYSATATISDAKEERQAIACRGADGVWHTRAVLVTDS
jgi:surface antigen